MTTMYVRGREASGGWTDLIPVSESRSTSPQDLGSFNSEPIFRDASPTSSICQYPGENNGLKRETFPQQQQAICTRETGSHEDVARDATLLMSTLLDNYLEAYCKYIYFITPVHLPALDSRFVRNTFPLAGSESGEIILFNFYVAVALGAKQCGALATSEEYLNKARQKASDLFDCSSYAVAEGLTALALASFSENDWVRGSYYLELAGTICKNIGAQHSHTYLRGIWWKGILPENTAEARLELITEYNTTRSLPLYTPANEIGFPAPVAHKVLHHLNSLSRIVYSCYTIVSLSSQENSEERTQTNLHLLDVLKNATEQLNELTQSDDGAINATVCHIWKQTFHGLYALVYWQLDAKLLALQWARKFQEGTRATEWEYGITLGMLHITNMVFDILVTMKEFNDAQEVLDSVRFLCMKDKSCKIAFDSAQSRLQAQRHLARLEKSGSYEEKMVQIDDEETYNQPPHKTEVKTETASGRKRVYGGEGVEANRTKQQKAQTETKKQKLNVQRESSPEEGECRSQGGGGKQKKLQWYQWENTKMGVGGFNRESAIVTGERVFRIGKRKKGGS